MLLADLKIFAMWSMQVKLGWWWIWLSAAAIPLLVAPAIFWRGRRMAYLSILCSLVAIGLAYLWYRGAQARLSIYIGIPLVSKANTENVSVDFRSGGGGVGIVVQRKYAPNPLSNEVARVLFTEPFVSLNEAYPHPDRPEMNRPGGRFDRNGFAATYSDDKSRRTIPPYTQAWLISIPNWFGIACVGWVPIFWLTRRSAWRRNAARKKGLCERCLFDLRGTPESPDRSRRCGECGHINPKSASIAAPRKHPAKGQ